MIICAHVVLCLSLGLALLRFLRFGFALLARLFFLAQIMCGFPGRGFSDEFAKPSFA